MLEWLLGLEEMGGAGVGGLEVGFARPVEVWAFGMIALACVGVGVWSYARMEGAGWARGVLGVARGVVLVVLLVLVLGPRAVEREELVERDRVVVLVDRSSSMGVADVEGGGGARVSREASLREGLSAAWEGLRGMMGRRDVVWLGFGEGVRELEAGADGVALGAAAGRRTDIGGALDEAAARVAGRPVAGVVVISDGRWTGVGGGAGLSGGVGGGEAGGVGGLGESALERLRAAGAGVYGVALGSASGAVDVSVARVEAPRLAFLADETPVTVELDRLGGAAGVPGSGVVRLIDEATGIVLDEQRVEFGGDGDDGSGSGSRVTLRAKAGEAGSRDWRVEVESDGADLVEANNSALVRVEFVDRPMRVLYVDGYPRWEQRYLKNLLIREGTVDVSALILSSDKRFLQEGNTEIDRLPSSAEGWSEFDVVVLGDVGPEVFTSAQLEQLREHVAVAGGGLVWAAGPARVPWSWHGTALGDLLPFVEGGVEREGVAGDVVMRPTGEAERLGVLRLGDPASGGAWPERLSRPETGWSRLRYAQRVASGGLKPASRVLGEGVPVLGGGATPLVMSMRFGAGKSVYVGTDETWRWRYGRGELLFERYWLQLVRMLGRERLARSGEGAGLEVAPGRAVVGQTVRVSVEVRDQALLERAPGTVGVMVSRGDASGVDGDGGGERLTLRRVGGGGGGSAGGDGAGGGGVGVEYAAFWEAGAPGAYRVRVDDPVFAGRGLEESVEVRWPTDELRRPQADHAALARLAGSTEGGGMIDLGDLGSLDELLPNRMARREFERAEPLWDSPLALIVVMGLLTFEWVGRRLIRLV